MKGSDKIEMSINIGGELIKLDVGFDDQNNVRDAEREVRRYLDRLKSLWPGESDKKIFAMAAYQFANWYHQLLKIQEEANDIINSKSNQIEEFIAMTATK